MDQVEEKTIKKQKMDDSDNIGTYMADEMMDCKMLLVIHICAANHCNYWILPNELPKKMPLGKSHCLTTKPCLMIYSTV